MHYYLKLGRSSDLINRKERRLYRAFEMLPGILAWTTLAATIFFSFVSPISAAIFIIIFNLYWLLRTIYLSIYLRIGFKQVQQNMKVNWLKELQNLAISDYQISTASSWNEIYHLIFLPRYKEDILILKATLHALIASRYPKEKMIVILTQEERAGKEENSNIAVALKEEFKNAFHTFAVVEHPAGIPGELAGKGSNIAWAGKYTKTNIIDPLKIAYEKIIVSAFDIDTIVMPEYFSRLTYAYLTTNDPLHASYQPVPFYINNVWESPAISRVSAFSTTFWQTIKQEQNESMITYSSHSMPFTALIKVDFWQDNVISEDSRIFWQCLFAYDGNYRVEPLYYPVSMDATLAPTYVQTMINVYKQHRRWGYGAENVPYFLFGFYKNKSISLKRKLRYSFVMIEGIWSWATHPIMLFMLGWLPILVGGSRFNQTVLAFNLPSYTSFTTTFAMLGLASSIIFALSILPPRPARYGKIHHVIMGLQWLLFPIRSIFFGAVPALEAQTRLMFGRYMGFWVTPKIRAKDEPTTKVG